MRIGSQIAALVFVAFMTNGCTQGHCRRQVDAPQAAIPVEAPPAKPVAPAQGTAFSKDNVFVYKYDGSQQCGLGTKIDVDTMLKELKGIPVVTSVKKSDGLMHIQVCGSLTGMANVFEIPLKYLKAAESKGFKKWSFE